MAFPTFEEYKGPWETVEGEFDADKAKRLLYNMDKDKYFINGKAEKAAEDLKETVKALDVYKAAEAAAKREGETEAQRLARENADLQEKLKGGSEKLERENLLLKVRLAKDLTEKQVNRLSGDTLEELLADADDYLAEAGVASSDGDDDDDGDGDSIDVVLNRQPKRKKTPGDPKPGSAPDIDVAKAIESIPRL